MDRVCYHYKKNNEGRYVNTFKKAGEHKYRCSECKCIVHDADIDRLNKRLYWLNNKSSIFPIDISDKLWMEAPVPVGIIEYPDKKDNIHDVIEISCEKFR